MSVRSCKFKELRNFVAVFNLHNKSRKPLTSFKQWGDMIWFALYRKSMALHFRFYRGKGRPWKGSEEGKGRKLLPSIAYQQLNKQSPAGGSRQKSVLLGPLETVQMHSHLVLSLWEARIRGIYLSSPVCRWLRVAAKEANSPAGPRPCLVRGCYKPQSTVPYRKSCSGPSVLRSSGWVPAAQLQLMSSLQSQSRSVLVAFHERKIM